MLKNLKPLFPRRLWRVARNQAARGRLLPCRSGTHDDLKPEEIVARARVYVDDYCKFASLTPELLAGSRMLEVGPGNHFVVALLFLSRGVSQVVCVDRFQSRPNSGQASAAYRLLFEQLTPEERRRCAGAFDDGRVRVTRDEKAFAHSRGSDRLVYLWDCSIESSVERLGHEQLDLIISRSVLEHVYSVSDAIRAMWLLLREGGRMVHKVDLRSHEEDDEQHPLEFLTHSERWWRWMTSHTGEPNRVRKGAYLRVLEDAGFHVHRYEVTHSVTRAELESIRDRLAEPFRHLPEDDLLETGMFFEARKPAARPQQMSAPDRTLVESFAPRAHE